MSSLGIDIGTTSCKLSLLSSPESDRLLFSEQLAHHAHLSQPDSPLFDEQSPAKILQTIDTLLEHAGVLLPIQSIQVCGQMHGLIRWSSQSPRTAVSSLITWQDQRCSQAFLDSLGPELKHLRTGYGLATLLWLSQEKREEGFDRAGTIADYLVAILCDEPAKESAMSDQMATSWGAVGKHWPTEHRLLPKIVEPGRVIGHWKGHTPVYVALGDLQCSVFSCQPGKDQGIVNISTSAQLALPVDREHSSPLCVPYFHSQELLVAASLNGGNVLSAFVHLVHSWQVSLADSPSPSLDPLWSRLIELARRSTSTPLEHFSAALFGERHDPSMCAEVRHLRSSNVAQLSDLGCVFRSICRWIIVNLFAMLGDDVRLLKGLIGTGSALMRNAVLQDELRERIDEQLVFHEHCDAAFGAALFASRQ